MKRTYFLLAPILLTSCSTHMVTYEFNSIDEGTSVIILTDNRSENEKLPQNPCRNRGIARIGDQHIRPSKLELLKDRFSKNEKFITGGEISLETFNIGMVIPATCANTQAAAVAGAVSSISGSATAHFREAKEEGIYCEIKYSIKGKTYEGFSYVEAQEGIDQLNSFSFDTSGLLGTIKEAVDLCISESLV